MRGSGITTQPPRRNVVPNFLGQTTPQNTRQFLAKQHFSKGYTPNQSEETLAASRTSFDTEPFPYFHLSKLWDTC